MRDVPFDAVKAGKASRSSMASTLIEAAGGDPATEDVMRSAVGTLFSGVYFPPNCLALFY